MTNTIKNKNIAASILATHNKRKQQVCHVYKIKIDYSNLSNLLKEQLKMLFVEAKWIYNDALSFSETNSIYDYVPGNTVSHFDKDRNKVETELQYIGSLMKQSVVDGIKSSIKTLSSLKKRGSKVGKLRYLSEYRSLNLKLFGTTYKIIGNNKVKLQNIHGHIRVRGLKLFIGIPDIELANAKILNTARGYYIAITTYVPKKEHIVNKNNIGLDFGCATTVTTSTGDKYSVVIEETERLKRLQRKLTKKKKGSNSYNKCKFQLKREYEHISNMKNDRANKLAALLHLFGRIIMQDELLLSWHQTDIISGKVLHSILGRLKSKLIAYHDTIVLSKWLPTTKLCTKCGTKIENMELSDRVFVCPVCGIKKDRDIHAALNMISLYEILVGMGHTDFKRDDKRILKDILKYFEGHEDTTF